MPNVFELAESPTAVVVKNIRRGLPAETFVQIANRLNLSHEVIATKLGLVSRTLYRKRKSRESLSPADSEKLMRVARIWNLAQDLFTTDEAIARWLMTPAATLGDSAPIDVLDTDIGTAEVEGLIRGLAHGNFQ